MELSTGSDIRPGGCSKWVPIEVDHWLKRHGARERVLFVLLDASETDPESFELALIDGLPAEVYTRFFTADHETPLMPDLREFSTKTLRPVENAEIRGQVAQVASRLLGVPNAIWSTRMGRNRDVWRDSAAPAGGLDDVGHGRAVPA